METVVASVFALQFCCSRKQTAGHASMLWCSQAYCEARGHIAATECNSTLRSPKRTHKHIARFAVGRGEEEDEEEDDDEERAGVYFKI